MRHSASMSKLPREWRSNSPEVLATNGIGQYNSICITFASIANSYHFVQIYVLIMRAGGIYSDRQLSGKCSNYLGNRDNTWGCFIYSLSLRINDDTVLLSKNVGLLCVFVHWHWPQNVCIYIYVCACVCLEPRSWATPIQNRFSINWCFGVSEMSHTLSLFQVP